MIENRQYIKGIELEKGEYNSLDELSKEVLQIYNDGLKDIYITYPPDEFQFEYVLNIAGNEDNSYIEVNFYRSETPEEKIKREGYEAKKQQEKDDKERAIQVRKTRLQLAQDDPDYIELVKLQEKFKDIL